MKNFFSWLASLFSKSVPKNSFPDDNTGIIRGVRETDYLGGTLPYEVRNPSGDWRSFLPAEERQYSNAADSMACVTFSHTSSLEIQARYMTGREYNWSDRFLAKLSGTTRQGNWLYKVADAVRQYGLVNEQSWPQPQNFSWDNFYSDIPAEVLARGKAEFPFAEAYEWISTNKANLLYHLKHAPIQITIPGTYPIHAALLVAIVGDVYYYFDSYPPFLKTMTAQPADAMKLVLYDNTIPARLVGWQGIPEEGLYFPFDTLERKRAVIDAITEKFPGYRVDPKKVVLGKKPF